LSLDGIIYYLDLKYPLKIKKSLQDPFGEEDLVVTSMSKTVKTRAGTFKNCIEIQGVYSGYKLYFAPNVGFIKSGYDGLTKHELIKLKNR